jgi:DNA-binding transcriptional regulator YdaS (Cro superfamily)
MARALGVTPQAVDNWTRRGRVPAEHVPRMEQAFGHLGVTAEQIRPDIPWSVIRGNPAPAASEPSPKEAA